MSMIMTNLTQSAASATTPAGALPAQAADVKDAAAQPGAVQAGAQAVNAAQPFAAWLGDQAQAALLAVQAGQPATGAEQGAAVEPSDADTAKAADGEQDAAAPLPPDGALLAAMAMPLMPLTPVQVAQAVQAAQPSGVQTGAQSDDADAEAAASTQAVSALADRGNGSDAGRRAATMDRAAALPQASEAGASPAARPVAVQADAAPAVRFAVHAQADAAAGANAGARDGGEQAAGGNGSSNGNGNAASAAAIAGAAATPTSAAPATDTVKLAGPPAAWRQSLQEALGERMHVQVGKGIEQAVIRLEPPQLGRIDIAIRHSAGSLEVNISATNGEVLRQLQTVSDNLRSDLSQRQFSEVAVTVTPAPKNGAAPFGDPQQGRGRQQDRDQEDKQPGRALAEAGNNASGFSLGGRDHA